MAGTDRRRRADARKHTVTLTFTLLHEPDREVEAAAERVTRAIAAELERLLPRVADDAMQEQRAAFEGRVPAGRWRVRATGPVSVDGKELVALQARLAPRER